MPEILHRSMIGTAKKLNVRAVRTKIFMVLTAEPSTWQRPERRVALDTYDIPQSFKMFSAVRFFSRTGIRCSWRNVVPSKLRSTVLSRRLTTKAGCKSRSTSRSFLAQFDGRLVDNLLLSFTVIEPRSLKP